MSNLDFLWSKPAEEISDLTHEDLPVGARVKVICKGQDFHFFNGDKGKVVRSKPGHLGIIVKFDEPRHYRGGWTMYDFNFNPDDLILLERPQLQAIPEADLLHPPEDVFV